MGDEGERRECSLSRPCYKRYERALEPGGTAFIVSLGGYYNFGQGGERCITEDRRASGSTRSCYPLLQSVLHSAGAHRLAL